MAELITLDLTTGEVSTSEYVPFIPPEAPLAVPYAVSAWGIRKALNVKGLRAAVETAVEQSTDQNVKDGWNYATEFLRDQPLVLQMAEAVSVTSEELDEIFRLAATL